MMEHLKVSRALCVSVRGRRLQRYAVIVGSGPWRYSLVDTERRIAVMLGTPADVIHYVARCERAAPEDVSVEECR
jgi:hypothetical protein